LKKIILEENNDVIVIKWCAYFHLSIEILILASHKKSNPKNKNAVL